MVMLNCHIGLPQYQPPLSKAQIPVYFQKIVDRAMMGATITQQLDYALINGQLLHSDNNIIIFSHQLLQTTSVLVGFFILNRKGR